MADLHIQFLIARAVDGDMSALMASLGLIPAFYIVNIELLLKRLKITGLPPDCITLISLWLARRNFYLSLNGNNSFGYSSSVGKVQESTHSLCHHFLTLLK